MCPGSTMRIRSQLQLWGQAITTLSRLSNWYTYPEMHVTRPGSQSQQRSMCDPLLLLLLLLSMMILIVGFICPPIIYFKFITKCDSVFYYKVRQSVITKCDNFITKCDWQVLLSAMIIKKCDSTLYLSNRQFCISYYNELGLFQTISYVIC